MLPSVCFLDSDQLGRSKAAKDAPLRLHGARLAARPPHPRRAWLAGAVHPRARLPPAYIGGPSTPNRRAPASRLCSRSFLGLAPKKSTSSPPPFPHSPLPP